ncbi:MAG: HAD family phosphatase [Akkermansia sp.]|nr:HAD family phosphatase [Akkermansia sp.]
MSARVILPKKIYAGYIFDLDGTLVDSMPVHFKAWRWALHEHGAPYHVFQWEEFVAHGGMAAPDIVADLNATYGLSMEPETVADDKRNRYAWLLQNETLPVIPETVNLVRRLKEQGIPYAIGTGSMPSGATETLQSAGVADLFPIMVTPADVPPGFGKPRPDIFLHCAERMGVNPQECVVFEDAEPGIQAAMAGGMDYVRVGECPPVRD